MISGIWWTMSSLANYLERSALISLEKQDKLSFLLDGPLCDLDLETGKIRFNNDLMFSFQVLGTESDHALNWLWAWADAQTEEIPATLLQASRELREWGSKHGVQELTSPSVDLDRADGHMVSMIASDICRASCYYRDAYDGGSAFVLIFDARIDAQPSFDLSRLSSRYLEIISRYEINHREALLSYLRRKTLQLSDTGSSITCELESGESLNARYDGSGNLVSLNGETIDP